jgi:hypothetical protein
MGKAEMKVPGGKLLRATSTIKDGRIEEVRITGDFFMHPEEAIDELERRLRGVQLDEVAIRRAVEAFFMSVAPTVLGAAPQDFAEVVLRSASA